MFPIHYWPNFGASEPVKPAEPDPLPTVVYRRCMECANLTAYQCLCGHPLCPRSECRKDHDKSHP